MHLFVSRTILLFSAKVNRFDANVCVYSHTFRVLSHKYTFIRERFAFIHKRYVFMCKSVMLIREKKIPTKTSSIDFCIEECHNLFTKNFKRDKFIYKKL